MVFKDFFSYTNTGYRNGSISFDPPKISRSLPSTIDKFTGGTLSRDPAPSRPSSTHTSSLELPSGSPMGSSWSKPSREAMPDRYVPFLK
jgi:hypothetical protein